MTHSVPSTGRRAALALLMAAGGLAAMPWPIAAAQNARDANADAAGPIQRLDAALLSVMKQGSGTPFAQRFAILAPAIDDAFDLHAILAASIGLRWQSLSDSDRNTLLSAFRNYTVSSYLANFDSYTGQAFQVSPTQRSVGNNELIVATRITRTDGTSTKLDYVLHHGPTSWKVVDVLANGSISRVAMQRSDFRHLLLSGGVAALAAGLQNKVANLSGGMLA